MTFGVLIEAGPRKRWQEQCVKELEKVASLRLDTAKEAEVERAIESADLDFVLCLKNVPPELPKLPSEGLWFFLSPIAHPETPTSFWEIREGRSVTEAALCRRRQDGNISVLERGAFRTFASSRRQSCETVRGGFVTWPRRACQRLAQGAGIDESELKLESRPRLPGLPDRMGLALTLFRNYLGAQLRSMFMVDQWNVGRTNRRPDEWLVDQRATDVKWFPAMPRNEFIADPFPAPDDSGEVWVEGYDYRKGVGYLAAYDGETGQARGDRLVCEHHLSYPHFVRSDGRWHCVPEAAGSGTLRAYPLVDGKLGAPETWFDEPLYDATFFEHEGRWWMLATSPGRYADTQLHAWHADNPKGPWREHPMNPLKSDVRSSRPGGTVFRHGDGLYRPAQDCAASYGAALRINRIVELTTTAFREETVATIDPDPRGDYPHGIHTLSIGKQTFVDGKRRRFVPAAFLSFLSGKCGRLFRRLIRR